MYIGNHLGLDSLWTRGRSLCVFRAGRVLRPSALMKGANAAKRRLGAYSAWSHKALLRVALTLSLLHMVLL